MKVRYTSLIAIILLVSLFRWLPHPPNATPVLAMALFSGAYLMDRRLAILVPLLAMLVSDMVIGLHSTMLFVYIGVVITVLLGRYLILPSRSMMRIVSASFISTIVFFLISNFGAWLALSDIYPRSLSGLMAAYIAAIPFYHNSVLATLFFAGILFGGYYCLERFYSINPLSK